VKHNPYVDHDRIVSRSAIENSPRVSDFASNHARIQELKLPDCSCSAPLQASEKIVITLLLSRTWEMSQGERRTVKHGPKDPPPPPPPPPPPLPKLPTYSHQKLFKKCKSATFHLDGATYTIGNCRAMRALFAFWEAGRICQIQTESIGDCLEPDEWAECCNCSVSNCSWEVLWSSRDSK